MANSMDRRINQIQRDVVDCLTRVVAAIALDHGRPATSEETKKVISVSGNNADEIIQKALKQEFNLSYNWLIKALVTIKNSVASIDPRRVAIIKKQGESTFNSFEKYINEAQYQITQPTSGIFACTKRLFNETGTNRPTTESLSLLHEVSGKATIIQRNLEILKKPSLGWLYSYKLAATILACAFIAAPLSYVYRAREIHPHVPNMAVQMQLHKDTVTIQRNIDDPEKSGFKKALAVAKEISDGLQAIPKLFTGVAGLLFIYQYVAKRRWRNRGVDGFRQDLLEASNSVSKQLKRAS